MIRTVVLGSTGSIGRQTLDVVSSYPGEMKVVGLAARKDWRRLIRQINQFQPEVVALADREAAARLRTKTGSMEKVPEVLSGVEGVNAVATAASVDRVVSAIVGAAGLAPTLAAVRAGHDIALANKETLVVAGELLMNEAEQAGVDVLPVDSEHNAIHQCLRGVDAADISRLILTASGGPFRTWEPEQLEKVTAQQAVAHPNWDMGPKNSVDSASLMNKGLEVIEARWLFDIPVDRIRVVVHPESIVHSLVELVDGSTLAQLSPPDMRQPIKDALTFPERWPSEALNPEKLDLAQVGSLHFEEPRMDVFPCLSGAYRAAKMGGTMPAVLNAANEVAVHAFLDGLIRFPTIPRIIFDVMEEHTVRPVQTLDDIETADHWARDSARRWIERFERKVNG